MYGSEPARQDRHRVTFGDIAIGGRFLDLYTRAICVKTHDDGGAFLDGSGAFDMGQDEPVRRA